MCLAVVYCVSAAYITDWESSTRPISVNPGSTERSGRAGLTGRPCFVAARFEAEVAVLLWFRRCVLGVAEFHCSTPFFCCERTYPTACIRQPYLPLHL